MANNKIEFPMPQGFTAPENLDADNSFEAMATFRVAGNQLQLLAIEGYEVGEGSMEASEEQEPGAGEAAPTPPAAGAGLAGARPGPGMGADQLAAGVPPDQTQGYAERLGQMFRKATRRR